MFSFLYSNVNTIIIRYLLFSLEFRVVIMRAFMQVTEKNIGSAAGCGSWLKNHILLSGCFEFSLLLLLFAVNDFF